MDPTRFDRLVASLVRPGNRRGLLRLLAAVPVVSLPLVTPPLPAPFGTLFAEEGEAAKGQKVGAGKKQVGADKKKKCARAGQRTNRRHRRCCPGLVKRGKVCTQPNPPPSPPTPPPTPPACTGLKPTNISPTQGLQEAINAANNGDTLTLCPGTWNMTASVNINKGIKLVGAGAGKTILRGADGADITVLRSNIFSSPALTLTLEGLTITDGQAVGNDVGSGSGGGIFASGNLTLNGVEVFGNQAAEDGGGIFHSGGTLTLGPGTTVHQNRATTGAGIFNTSGPMDLLAGSSVTENFASTGGGIYNTVSNLTLHNGSTVSKNEATTSGGGIVHDGGFGLGVVSLTLTGGSRLTGNSSVQGGGIYATANGGAPASTIVRIESNSRISGNSAGPGGGGAIFNSNAHPATVNIVSGALICSNAPLDNQCQGAKTGTCPAPAQNCPPSAAASAQRRRGDAGAERRRGNASAHRRHGRKP
jgi:hypothetical protein